MDDLSGFEKDESGRRRSGMWPPSLPPSLPAAPAAPHVPPSPQVLATPPPPPGLLQALRERLRYLHYSLRTEEAYVHWVRHYVQWSGRRHPRTLGVAEVVAFLTMLANERRVAAATHRQALSALLFLYREVLGVDMPWMRELGRPVTKKRIPVVLTHVEVQALLARMGHGTTGLLARLLYGTGMRLLEGLRLRIKDVDFVRQVIVVREGKGGKDRVVMLPRSLDAPLRVQLSAARQTWLADRAQGLRHGVYLPHALAAKYPRAAESPLDGLMIDAPGFGIGPEAGSDASVDYRADDRARDRAHDRADAEAGTRTDTLRRRPGPRRLRAREPVPCYRITPSFTAAATSAS